MTHSILTMIREGVPDLVALYEFGSSARGEVRRDSDLDLAFLARLALPSLARWELQERLAVELGRDVDLVDLRTASAVLKAQVITTGSILVDVDASERHRFEMYSLSDYARLNEERRPVLKRIEREGAVHA